MGIFRSRFIKQHRQPFSHTDGDTAGRDAPPGDARPGLASGVSALASREHPRLALHHRGNPRRQGLKPLGNGRPSHMSGQEREGKAWFKQIQLGPWLSEHTGQGIGQQKEGLGEAQG